MNYELYQLEGAPGITLTGANSIRVSKLTCILDVEFFPKKNEATVITTCPSCRQPAMVEHIPADPLILWLQDIGNVGDLLPSLSADDRETLMTGMHGKCFDDIFEEDEYDDDDDEDEYDDEED